MSAGQQIGSGFNFFFFFSNLLKFSLDSDAVYTPLQAVVGL